MNNNDMATKFAYLREQREVLIKNIALLEEKLKETAAAKSTLKEIDKVNEGEILMPIGGGCFVEAELKKLDTVTINIGDGVSKEASVDEALSKLDELTDNIQSTAAKMNNNLSKVEKELGDIQKEIRGRRD
ncbi:MAG: prefoldin subunit alpha [Euryarchaeota archaeon]|nr:prefoldin subunit alpha [Euryarchaeota archaeon]